MFNFVIVINATFLSDSGRYDTVCISKGIDRLNIINVVEAVKQIDCTSHDDNLIYPIALLFGIGLMLALAAYNRPFNVRLQRRQSSLLTTSYDRLLHVQFAILDGSRKSDNPIRLVAQYNAVSARRGSDIG